MSSVLISKFSPASVFAQIRVAFAALLIVGVVPAAAQTTSFERAVADAASTDEVLAAFYADRAFAPIWTGSDDLERRRALVDALAQADGHGLPTARYDVDQILRDLASAKSSSARGRLEVEITKRFLQYARDIHSGAIEPRSLGEEFAVKLPRKDRLETLIAFTTSDPAAFIDTLPPQNAKYAGLLAEKIRLEEMIATGGWGAKVSAKALKPGSTSSKVVELRDRLTRMGYHHVSTSVVYDDLLSDAVAQFQIDHGMNADGVAGPATITTMNISADYRLQQVIVGLERQRWLNKPLGERHIFVNQADFRAHVMDGDRATLTTRVVVGKRGTRFRTPEFSDKMSHLIINPTWNVPKSIAQKEYLPMLLKDPTTLTRLGIRMTDRRGQRVDAETLDYTEFAEGNFPFDLKQPPGNRNALGKVKFMFPNKFNIYLHDTPSKSLFARDGRTFSHGCVRVQKPFELAYTLLGKQTDDPETFFKERLGTRRETRVDLEEIVPVHLTYHTAWVSVEGRPNYRSDVYGRDKKVFNALSDAGLALGGLRG